MGRDSAFLLILGVTIFTAHAFPHPTEDIITQPKPGEEYVFVQTSGSGARPIARKDKHTTEERHFETAHKLPPSVTYALNQDDEEKLPVKSKPHKREANPADAPAPAPAGAIKLDVKKLLEKYKTELKTSSTTRAPKTTSKASRRGGNRRTKKEAKEETEVTSIRPVLTTGAAAPKQIDDDIPLVASGSEKQRSRIQIKKAPNGQEYEYEYVYYYYDEDESDKKTTNAHDGPAHDQISKNSKTRGSVERTSAAPEANEVVPSSRGKTRGRQLGEEQVGEERLPANTRFPPRSRNLNTTPLPEEETKTTRGRGRGRPTTEAAPSATTEADNVSDETQGSRGRTRANVRRPSLELVDNASFNTHPGSEPSGSSPSFPTDLPAGPVRFLGATPNESVDPPEPISSDKDPEAKKEEPTIETTDETGTTVMSPMDKVALDLYAILQGTQKLSGEDALATEENSTDNDPEITTLEITTEEVIETTTPTTTTTTTTTTTPAPTTTTTTTTEAPTGRGRFKGRGRKTTHAASSTTEATHSEAKPKSKFSRPSFGGRPRPGGRTTPEPAVEQDASKEESKPVSHARPTLSRSRFGATRTRTRTTAAPSEANEESSSSSTSAPAARPSLTRPRSSFNLRTRGRSTTPATEEDKVEDSVSSETVSTTARTRRIQASSGVRPLRPGPRINLARNRPGQTTTTTTEEPAEDHVAGDEEVKSEDSENPEEKESESSPAPVDNSPLGRLRNKHRINVQAKPKAAASAPVQVRRVNPLIARRRPGQTTEASSSEAPQEPASTEEAAEAEESEETEAPVASSTTTEEPRGLNKLLAGRRRLGSRPPAHH